MWGTPLKRSKNREFALLRRKLCLQIAGSALGMGIGLICLISVLQGHFATFMIPVIRTMGGLSQNRAAAVYDRIIRSRQDLLIWFMILAACLIWLHFLVQRITSYFADVQNALLQLKEGRETELHLAAELQPLERSLNTVRLELCRQRDQAQLAEQKKSDLVMYLAHDLKTPLASTVGYLNLVLDEPDISRDTREKYLRIALAKSLRLEDMVQEFLEISRYSLTTISLNRRMISLGVLLEQLAGELQPAMQKQQLHCSVKVSGDLKICCDPEKLSRVFDNLLRNAILYSREDTEIQVDAQASRGCIRVSIANYGDSIPPDRLEHVFDPFYRIDPGRRTEGTGLGLAIARQIIEKHGGTIEAESGSQMTCFTVQLPLTGDPVPQCEGESL